RPRGLDRPMREVVAVDGEIAERGLHPPQAEKSLEFAREKPVVAGRTLRVIALDVEHVPPTDQIKPPKPRLPAGSLACLRQHPAVNGTGPTLCRFAGPARAVRRDDRSLAGPNGCTARRGRARLCVDQSCLRRTS